MSSDAPKEGTKGKTQLCRNGCGIEIYTQFVRVKDFKTGQESLAWRPMDARTGLRHSKQICDEIKGQKPTIASAANPAQQTIITDTTQPTVQHGLQSQAPDYSAQLDAIRISIQDLTTKIDSLYGLFFKRQQEPVNSQLADAKENAQEGEY